MMRCSCMRTLSAVLLLLCAVDSLARDANPSNMKSPERFENFLRSKMRRPGVPQVWNIAVPRLEKSFSFEYIISKFLRCPLVHEGNQLVAVDQECPVVLDLDEIPNGLKVDASNDRLVTGGELAFRILSDSICHELEIEQP